MSNYFGFTSDSAYIFLMDIDSSGSMDGQVRDMRQGLGLYQKSFEGLPEINSIAVSKCTFNDDFYPDYFRHLRDFNTNYSTGGATALYYSIVKGAEMLLEYVQEVTERKGFTPIATFIVFSDGEPCRDRATARQAAEAIDRLNYAGINTVFVAFGNAISSNFGDDLGFVSTIDINDKEALIDFLGVELSNSCKKQSQRNTPLGAEFFSSSSGQKKEASIGSNFFSKANGQSTSAAFSATTGQALEDDGWLDEII